jgi:hypothetical protein
MSGFTRISPLHLGTVTAVKSFPRDAGRNSHGQIAEKNSFQVILIEVVLVPFLDQYQRHYRQDRQGCDEQGNARGRTGGRSCRDQREPQGTARDP